MTFILKIKGGGGRGRGRRGMLEFLQHFRSKILYCTSRVSIHPSGFFAGFFSICIQHLSVSVVGLCL